MNKKKTMIIWLSIIAVCIAVVFGYGLFNRTTMREATTEEIERYSAYAVGWQSATGLEGSDTEIILSLCSFVEEQTIGENRYKSYSSDVLGDYLHNFSELTTVSLYLDPETGEEGTLYIQYTDKDGCMAILGYEDVRGLVELGVYNPDSDTFYHLLGGEWEVWEKFAGGVRWGMSE